MLGRIRHSCRRHWCSGRLKSTSNCHFFENGNRLCAQFCEVNNLRIVFKLFQIDPFVVPSSSSIICVPMPLWCDCYNRICHFPLLFCSFPVSTVSSASPKVRSTFGYWSNQRRAVLANVWTNWQDKWIFHPKTDIMGPHWRKWQKGGFDQKDWDGN